jgi:hypothetical protein
MIIIIIHECGEELQSNKFFLQNVWAVLTGLHVYVAGSSGPYSRASASLGSRDSEPTAATGQLSGKQQQQVFVSFTIENVGDEQKQIIFFLLHLPELCAKSIASWKLSVHEMIIQSGCESNTFVGWQPH